MYAQVAEDLSRKRKSKCKRIDYVGNATHTQETGEKQVAGETEGRRAKPGTLPC